MTYFNRMQFVTYDYGAAGKVVTPLMTSRTNILSKYKSDQNYYVEYTIQEGDSPETLADRFYDNPFWSWIILVYNDIIDVWSQWPMSERELTNYCNRVYDDINAVHHYVSFDGNIVDSTHTVHDRVPVTNYEYEVEQNEARRKIKLLLPEMAATVVRRHNELMGE